MKCCTMALLTFLSVAAAVADDFTGVWQVTEIVGEREGFPWSLEIKYPKQMVLEMRSGRLAGLYTDQNGFSCEFPVIQEFNQGRDLLLAHCGETKAPEAYAPIHHVKLRDGKLRAVVTTNEKLFEWVAVRAK